MNKKKQNITSFINKKIEMLESTKKEAYAIFKESRVGSNSSAKWGTIATACHQKQELLEEIKDEIEIQFSH